MKAIKRGLNNLGNGRNHHQGDNKTLNAEKKRNALFQPNSSGTANFEGAGGQSPGVDNPETRGVSGEHLASITEANSDQPPQPLQSTGYDINTPSNDYRVEHGFPFDNERILPENSHSRTTTAKVHPPSNEASGHHGSESARSKVQTHNKWRFGMGEIVRGNKDKSHFNHSESVLVGDSGPSETLPKPNRESVIQNQAGNGDYHNGRQPLRPDVYDSSPPKTPPKPNGTKVVPNQGGDGKHYDGPQSLRPNDRLSPFSDAHESTAQDVQGGNLEKRRLSSVTPSSPHERNPAARTRHMSQSSATLETLRSGLTIESPAPSAESDTDHDPSAATSNLHSECQSDLAELEEIISELQEAAGQGTEKLNAASKRIAELEKDKTTLEDLDQARKNALKELQQQMTGIEAKGRQMSKQLNDVTKELTNTKAELERSRNEHRSVTDKLRKTAVDVNNANGLNKWYADKVKVLENENARQAYRLRDLQPQLKDSQEELVRANRQSEDYRRSVQTLQSSNAALSNEVSELKGYLSNATGQLNILRAENSKHRHTINTIQPKLAKAEKDLTERIDEVARFKAIQITDRDTAQRRLNACKADLATLRAETKKKIDEAESTATRTIQMWQAEKDEEISSLKAVHDSKLSQLREEHKTAVQNLNAQLQGYESKAEGEKAAIRTKHKTQLATITQQHETKVAELKAQLDKEQAEHQSEILEVTADIAEQLVEKAKEYENATEQLRDDLQTLNSRLLTHDDHNFQGEIFAVKDLPNSPDELLRSQFADIVYIVDSLGRIEWKENPSVWTNDILKAADGRLGNRRLKKAIVQDTVWSVLFRYVFCSPFRMFGAEGEILEQQWASQCGQSSNDDEIFTWPRPGIKAERWRFITVKNCRDTLLPPQPSEWDPRKRVMKDYLKNLHDCRTALIVALENIADLEEESIGYINQLPKKAATIGMNFAMHRCRIVIEMIGKTGLSMADKAAAARNNNIELTRVPALRRYGNVMGVNLDQSQIVGNFGGDPVNVP